MERENPLLQGGIVKIAITPMLSTLSLMENANSESEVSRIWTLSYCTKLRNVHCSTCDYILWN